MTFLGVTETGRTFGQVVQLPTVGVTGAATTVSVPDRGGALIGGVGRASSGSTSRGIGPGRLLGNRAIGSSVSAGGISAHATIIDLDEMDAAVLAEAESRRDDLSGSVSTHSLTPRRSAARGKAAFLSRNIVRRTSGTSAGEGSSTASAATSRPQSEAELLLEEAMTAAAAGKREVARVYLQMAERRADGELVTEIRERIAALDLPTTGQASAHERGSISFTETGRPFRSR